MAKKKLVQVVYGLCKRTCMPSSCGYIYMYCNTEWSAHGTGSHPRYRPLRRFKSVAQCYFRHNIYSSSLPPSPVHSLILSLWERCMYMCIYMTYICIYAQSMYAGYDTWRHCHQTPPFAHRLVDMSLLEQKLIHVTFTCCKTSYSSVAPTFCHHLQLYKTVTVVLRHSPLLHYHLPMTLWK